MDSRWYKKSCYRNLVDMHIANGDDRLLADFDADTYAENMKTAGFDTAYVYASNCLGLCLYPSKAGYLHQAAKTRDIFGETVAALALRGIRPIGYLNNWSTAAYDAHPDWRVVNAEGKGYRDHPGHAGRYGVLCPNSPYRDYFLGLVGELTVKYSLEGLWVDMVGFWRGACYCAHCKEKFKKETGEEIPLTVNWSDPLWRRYIRFKTDSLYRYAKDIVETAKRSNPNMSVSLQSAGFSLGHFLGFDERYFTLSDYAAGDFYTDVADAATDCKFLSSVTQNAPFEYMVSRCPTLTYHTVSKTKEMLRRQAYSAVLHGGAFLAIDAIDPEGTMNEEIYRAFREIKSDVAPFHAHPSYLAGESYAPIGVYINYASAFDPLQNGAKAGDTGGVSPLFARLKPIDRALARHHLSYDIVTPLRLSSLAKYRVLILSEVYTLSKEECDALRNYVKRGGRLYVSGKCGIYDPLSDTEDQSTLLREDFALSDVMGVTQCGTLPFDSCYLRGTEHTHLSPLLSKYPPATRSKDAARICAHPDTKVLARATLPFSSHTDGRRFISAISDPPWEKTDIPVLTEHTYGKGVCLYSPLLLEADKNDVMRELWLSLIEDLLSPFDTVKIDAPPCLEISVRRKEDTLYVFLLNALWEETKSAAGETVIRVPSELLSVNEATVFPSGKATVERTESGALIRVSALPEFAVLTLG